MLRYGRVIELDAAMARVRVAIDADEGMETDWLPVLRARSRGDRAYWMPELEEQVAVLLDGDEGVVLGALFSEPDPPPVTSANKAHLAFADGSWVEYDRATHKLEVTIVGGDVQVNVAANKKILIGGAGGQELATKTFVQAQYNLHTHISGSPGSPTSPPVTPAPMTPGVDVTKKQRSE